MIQPSRKGVLVFGAIEKRNKERHYLETSTPACATRHSLTSEICYSCFGDHSHLRILPVVCLCQTSTASACDSWSWWHL